MADSRSVPVGVREFESPPPHDFTSNFKMKSRAAFQKGLIFSVFIPKTDHQIERTIYYPTPGFAQRSERNRKEDIPLFITLSFSKA